MSNEETKRKLLQKDSFRQSKGLVSSIKRARFKDGKGWNPLKKVAHGYVGSFVANESFSKDTSLTLTYQGVNYELIPQPNGNFSTKHSSASEIF